MGVELDKKWPRSVPTPGACRKQQTYALLAKALAKHAGGYAALRSGRVADLFLLLSRS